MTTTDRPPHADLHGRPTLRSVATLAGVSVSTVSRVLSGERGGRSPYASPQTAARINALAQELGYVPNPHAAGLRTQQSHVLGVLVPRLSDMVVATIYEGIEEAAATAGYFTFVANTRDDPREQRARTEMFLSRHVDGLLLGDARSDAGFADEVKRRGIPFVLFSRHAGNHPSVTCDDVLGGCLAAQHLLALGHERVGVVAGEPYASTGIDRTAGFADQYAAAGIPIPTARIVRSRFDVQAGRVAAEQLLAQDPQPTAIFAVNDFAAIGVLGAVREAGKVAGRDIAVVGYNDVPLAAELPVPLTTLRSPMREMGSRSVDLLLRLLSGGSPESIRLPPILIPRASTGRNPQG